MSKTYDGSVNALDAFTPSYTVTGLVAGDSAATLRTGSAVFDSAHVLGASQVTVSGLSLDAVNGNHASAASDYVLSTTSLTLAGSITPQTLSASASIDGVLSKTYDGSSSAPGASVSGTVSGAVSGDVLVLDTSAVSLAYNSAHVLDASQISASGSAGYTLLSSSVGSVASDYDYSAPVIAPAPARITPATLTTTLSNSNVVKTYDGSLSAPAGFVPTYSVSGLVAGDSAASIGHGAAGYDSAHVIGASEVTVSGLALTGVSGNLASAPSDYVLASSANTVAAQISAKTVAVSGLAASAKVYDGGTAVQISDWGTAATGVGSEQLTLLAGSAQFDAPSAGGARGVTASGYRLADSANALASDYVLSSTSATTSADIHRAPLTVAANADAKIVTQADAAGYNGISASGFVNGETAATAAGWTAGSISRSNAGTESAGSYGGVLVPSGWSADNYSVQYAHGSYTIVPAQQLLIRVNNQTTTYGADPSFSLGSAQYLSSGNVLTTLTASQQVGNRLTLDDGVGGSVSLTLSPLGNALSGAGLWAVGAHAVGSSDAQISGGNFNGLAYAGTLDVQTAALSATTTGGTSKVYDGSTRMDGVVLGLSGVRGGDGVSVSGTGTFAAKDAGSQLAYSVNHLQLSGADAANYHLTGGGSLSASDGVITPKALSATGLLSADKAYDGTLTAAVLGTATLQAGVAVGSGSASDGRAYLGDVIHLAGTAVGAFNSKDVLGASSVSFTGLDLGGADAGNYTLAALAPVSQHITPRALSATVTAPDKVYDGNTTARPTLTLSAGLVGAETLGVSASGQFNSKNVAGAHTVTVDSVNLADGSNGGLASNYSLAAGQTTSAHISRLDSVTWVGGPSGNWFDPANWAGGAVPDLNNVANVVFPAGVNVSFGGTPVAPAEAGPVSIDSLGQHGSLTLLGGELNVGTGGVQLDLFTQSGGVLSSAGDVALGRFEQSGGSASVAGDFSTTTAYSQAGNGTLAVGGQTTLRSTDGALVIGNLHSGGTLTVDSRDGPIRQHAGTTLSAAGTTLLSASQGGAPADITLNGAGNDFVGSVSAQGRNVALSDANSLSLGTLSSSANATLISHGALDLGRSQIGGALNVNTGGGALTQSGVLDVAGRSQISTGGGSITLTQTGNRFAGGVAASGASVQINDPAASAANASYERLQAPNTLGTTTITTTNSPTASITSLQTALAAADGGAGSLVGGAGNRLSVRPAALGDVDGAASATDIGGAGGAGGVIENSGANGSSAEGSQAEGASTSNTSRGVRVDQTAAASARQSGTVRVRISPQALAAGALSFELPRQAAEALRSQSATPLATLANGQALPDWLRFDPRTLRFSASSVPPGALPLNLLVSAGPTRLRVEVSRMD